ncbi:MAG: hypothetical protein ACRDHY_16595 [Anaerolineales bacterium]
MRDNGSRSLLARAIEREDWETAALCMLLGAVEAANKLPRETLDALLDELDLIAPEPHRRSRGRKWRRRRGPA